MASLNKVQLIGRLGNDPKITAKDGQDKRMASFNLATNEDYNDTEGNKKEKTEWHKIVAFGKIAEICEKFLEKGSEIYLEGRNNTRQYSKEGQTHYITEVQIRNVQFLSTRN